MATQTKAKDTILDDATNLSDADVEDTALATTDETAIQVSPTVYSEAPAFVQEDLWVSKIRLGQGQTPEVQSGEARPGQWVLTGMPAQANPTVVPLRYAKLTRRFGIVNGQRYIACNRHQAEADMDCPNCRTQYEETLLKNPGFESVAEYYYSYVVYVVEADMPAVLEFARTGMNAGRLLNTFVMSKGMANFAIKLGATNIQGKKGTYWQPTVAVTAVSPDVIERAQAFLGASAQ